MDLLSYLYTSFMSFYTQTFTLTFTLKGMYSIWCGRLLNYLRGSCGTLVRIRALKSTTSTFLWTVARAPVVLLRLKTTFDTISILYHLLLLHDWWNRVHTYIQAWMAIRNIVWTYIHAYRYECASRYMQHCYVLIDCECTDIYVSRRSAHTLNMCGTTLS